MEQLTHLDFQKLNESIVSFLDNISTGILLICPTTNQLLFVNESLSALAEYTLGEMSAKEFDWHSLFTITNDQKKCTNFLQILNGQDYYQSECSLIPKNTQPFPIQLFCRIVEFDKYGLCIQFFLLKSTNLMNLESELNSLKEQLNTLTSTIPGGVARLIASKDFSILNASEGYYKLTGFTKEECFSPPILNKANFFVLDEDLPNIISAIDKLVKTGEPSCAEYRIQKKDGSIAWNTAYCSKVTIENGETILDAVFIDTTSAKLTENRLLNLSNRIPGGIARVKVCPELTVDFANDGFYTMAGYSSEEFMGSVIQGNYARILHPLDKSMVIEKFTSAFNYDNSCLSIDFRIINKSGQTRWIRANASRLDNVQDNSSFIECIFTGITSSKEIDKQLKFNEERYRIIFEQTQDIVFDWDIETGSIYRSNVFEQKFGYAPPLENTVDYIRNSDIIFHEDKQILRESINKLLNSQTYVQFEARVKNSCNEHIWCNFRITAILDETNKPYRAVGILSDIDNYKREAAYLQQKAQTDLLTGLLNKMTTQERIEKSLNHSALEHVCHVLYLIDIDNFKNINDQLGHQMGDAILAEIGSRIQNQFTLDDIIGRIGGDEFAVFAQDIPSEKIIYKKALHLSELFRHPFKVQNESYKISGSIGIAIYPDNGHSFETLYQRADAALYLSKRKGKDCFSFYSELKNDKIVAFSNDRKDRFIESETYTNIDFIQLIFEILYDAHDIVSAVNIIIELAARYYHISHIYIFENNDKKGFFCKTFEYCSDISDSFPENEDFYSNDESMSFYASYCDPAGVFLCTNIDSLPPLLKSHFQQRNVRSILQSMILENGLCKGIIGFSENSESGYWSKQEIDASIMLAKIISTFLLKRKSQL